MKIYVGNLAYSTTSEDLRELCEGYGEVTSADVISDRDSGRSKGFGFVEMTEEEATKKAIEGLNGSELQGRTITVNEAKPRESRPRSDSRGGGYGGGGGRRY
ncbi:MAG TPA: RNA-binding protein [Candidatus Hydrogenedentes bacterium]|jgi:RNA recognition motif-containing protein|nr:MAG: RNA recognition motif [Candidatus Hydrogenedentes bacterium ADurb.Bin101]HOC68960.1 RNA-binding protein [Candidatus Hydrogenedentota bacterium]HQM99717.1 RNA-binding protein [Candidatus Hydrogenedentota bacterium]